MNRRVAVAAVSVLAVATAIAGGSAGAQTELKPSVTAAVQVSANPSPVRAHSSPQIAVNPTNGELVIVESDVRGTRACNAHISVDDGRSWLGGGDLMLEPYTDCSFYAEYGPYATAAFGKDGTLYVAYVASEPLNRLRDETPRHVILARSTDGGRTFAMTTVFKAPDGDRDRGLNKGPILAVDPTDPKRVYVGWRQGVFREAKEKLKSNIAASSDGGRAFRAPVDLTDERGGDYPGIAVDAKGTVHAVYWTRTWGAPQGQNPVRPIMYVRSTDRGKSFTKPKEIDPGNQATSRPPMLSADPDSGTLYLVWHGNAEPGNMAEGFAGDLQVFMRSSTNGGSAWSDRVVVNDDAGNANQYEPGIAIAPNGRVDVAWYDFRNDARAGITSTGHSGDRGFSDVYYSWSEDGARSFRPNVRVTDRSIDRSLGVWSNNIDSKFNLGVASTRNAVYLAWQDTRNGHGGTDAEDVYMASVRLRGAAAPLAGTAGAGIPTWALVAVGLALGMGIAGILTWLVVRGAPAAQPVRR